MSLPAREELKRTLRIAVLRIAPEARKRAAESMIITLNLGPRRLGDLRRPLARRRVRNGPRRRSEAPSCAPLRAPHANCLMFVNNHSTFDCQELCPLQSPAHNRYQTATSVGRAAATLDQHNDTHTAPLMSRRRHASPAGATAATRRQSTFTTPPPPGHPTSHRSATGPPLRSRRLPGSPTCGPNRGALEAPAWAGLAHGARSTPPSTTRSMSR